MILLCNLRASRQACTCHAQRDYQLAYGRLSTMFSWHSHLHQPANGSKHIIACTAGHPYGLTFAVAQKDFIYQAVKAAVSPFCSESSCMQWQSARVAISLLHCRAGLQ